MTHPDPTPSPAGARETREEKCVRVGDTLYRYGPRPFESQWYVRLNPAVTTGVDRDMGRVLDALYDARAQLAAAESRATALAGQLARMRTAASDVLDYFDESQLWPPGLLAAMRDLRAALIPPTEPT